MNVKHKNVNCLWSAISVLLLLSGASAYGETVRVGNAVPGAGPIRVNVKSIRALRFADMVSQHTDFSCGAAALATILKYAYGRDVTEAQMIEGLFKVSNPAIVEKEGFSLLDLKNYVEMLGYRGRGYKIEAQVLDNIRIPVIVLLDIKGYKHFVVFKKAAGNEVYVGDPALGNRVMTRSDFVASWNNIVFAVIGKGFLRDSVLIRPAPPLTAKRLVDGHTVITNAQLIDFGFTRADLF